MDEANWDHYIEHARQYIDSGRIEAEELEYKREVERDLEVMRGALLAGDPDWAGVMEKSQAPAPTLRLAGSRPPRSLRRRTARTPGAVRMGTKRSRKATLGGR